MSARTKKTERNLWDIEGAGGPDGVRLTVERAGRYYLVRADGAQIGTGPNLAAACAVAEAWAATPVGEVAASITALNPPPVEGTPLPPDVRRAVLWVEDDGANGWSIIRQYHWQQAPRIIRRVSGTRGDAGVALEELATVERTQGVHVTIGGDA